MEFILLSSDIPTFLTLSLRCASPRARMRQTGSPPRGDLHPMFLQMPLKLLSKIKKGAFFWWGKYPSPLPTCRTMSPTAEDAPDSFPTRAPSGFLQSADRDFRQHPRGRIMHVSAHFSEVFKLCRVIFRSTAYLQFDMWRLLAATYAPASF